MHDTVSLTDARLVIGRGGETLASSVRPDGYGSRLGLDDRRRPRDRSCDRQLAELESIATLIGLAFGVVAAIGATVRQVRRYL